MPHGDERVVVAIVREIEGGEGRVSSSASSTRPLQRFGEGADGRPGGRLVEAADLEIDGMDGAAAHGLDDLVAELFQRQSLGDDLGMGAGDLEGVLHAEKIGGMQHGRVQDVALDPLAAVNQPAQVPERTRDPEAERVLHRLAGAQHVGDGADAADPGGNVGRLGEHPPPEQGLEKARRFIDLEPDIGDLSVADADIQRALPLHAGQGADLDGARSGFSHAARFPSGTGRPRR